MVKHAPFALKHFIPISAPATRKPCGIEERSFRLSMGFLPQWYAQRAGVSFGQKWHEDCLYRYETLTAMKKHLHALFPAVLEFTPAVNALGYDEDCATLSGVYGSKVVAGLYGHGMQFPTDDWPGDVSNTPMSFEALANLRPIDLDSNPFMEKLEKQMEQMQRCFGRIDGYLNYQGVLNTAQKLRGNEIFMDMIEEPEFAEDLFAHIAQTIETLAKRVQARQRASGADIDLLSVSNCVVSMISPRMYENFILPHDEHLSRQFARFGVHTCNWNVTPYMNALSKIERMGYLDMSADSDLARARELFPSARLAIFFTPGDIERKPFEQLADEFRVVARAAHPCDIVFADMTPGTDPVKLQKLLDLADQIESEIESHDL